MMNTLKAINPKNIIITNGIVRIIAMKRWRSIDEWDKVVYKNTETFIYNDLLEWHYDITRYEEPFLSLAEIEEQLLKAKYTPPFYVWHDDYLDGIIYEYGNYNPPSWVIHGRTKGFA